MIYGVFGEIDKIRLFTSGRLFSANTWGNVLVQTVISDKISIRILPIMSDFVVCGYVCSNFILQLRIKVNF